MNDDARLLHEYATTGSQPAFAELATRYVDLVYSSARRQVRDVHLAEDVTQAVFIVLATKAKSVPGDRPMSSWLLKVTSYCAANARRARAHRETHERRAAEMAPTETSDREWETLAPLLDEGLAKLRQTDREALLLKYFEKKSLQEVGAVLGLSEDAAQKRVTRAVERLRDFFQRRGATITVAALSTLLIAESAQAAPEILARAVCGGGQMPAYASGAAQLAKGAMMAMAVHKTTMVVASVIVLLLAIGGGVVVVHSMATHPGKGVIVSNTAKPQAAGAVSFSDGTSVDILGMTEASRVGGIGDVLAGFVSGGNAPSRNSVAWWGADGSLIQPISLNGFGNLSVGGDAGTRQIRMIFLKRGPGVAAGASLSVEVVGVSRGSAMTSRIINNQERIDFVFSIPADIARTKIRFGLASGAWREDASIDASDTTAPKPDALFQNITEENNVCSVEVNWKRIPLGNRDTRMVAILKNGKEVGQQEWYSHGGNRAVLKFPCRKQDVAKLAWRTRPYEWQTSDEVWLKPAKQAGATTQPSL